MNYPNSDFLMLPVNSSTFMVIGGSGSVHIPNTLYAFNAITGRWANMTGDLLYTPIPPLRGSALTYFNGGFSMSTSYVVGGATYGDNTSTLFTNIIQVDVPIVYTRLLDPYPNLVPSISYRIGHVATSSLSTISVFGGQQLVNNQLQSVSMNQVSKFDTILSTWKTVSFSGPTPTSRSYFTITQSSTSEYLNQYILFGGINADTNQLVTDLMYKVSINDGSYESINAMNAPSPRFGHSAVFYGSNSLLILNGMDSTGTVLNDINVFNTVGKQWMDQFLTLENYPGISNNNNNGGGSSTSIYYYIDPSSTAITGGLGGGLFVFILLSGFALHKYVEKYTLPHQENDLYDIKESDQYNNNNNNNNNNQQLSSLSTNQHHSNNTNNYQSSSSSSPPPIDHCPLPPTPNVFMPTGLEYNASSSPIFYQQDVPYPKRQ
ncbi:unnamed protein product [Cunninghamella blakesleeana]